VCVCVCARACAQEARARQMRDQQDHQQVRRDDSIAVSLPSLFFSPPPPSVPSPLSVICRVGGRGEKARESGGRKRGGGGKGGGEREREKEKQRERDKTVKSSFSN
jgi:hypothetical protein